MNNILDSQLNNIANNYAIGTEFLYNALLNEKSKNIIGNIGIDNYIGMIVSIYTSTRQSEKEIVNAIDAFIERSNTKGLNLLEKLEEYSKEMKVDGGVLTKELEVIPGKYHLTRFLVLLHNYEEFLEIKSLMMTS